MMKSLVLAGLVVVTAGLPAEMPPANMASSVSSAACSGASDQVQTCGGGSSRPLEQTGNNVGGAGGGPAVGPGAGTGTGAGARNETEPLARGEVEADLKDLLQAPIKIIGNMFNFKGSQKVLTAMRMMVEISISDGAQSGSLSTRSYLEPCSVGDAFGVFTKVGDKIYPGPPLQATVPASSSSEAGSPGTGSSGTGSPKIDLIYDNVNPQRVMIQGDTVTKKDGADLTRHVIDCPSLGRFDQHEQRPCGDNECQKNLNIRVEPADSLDNILSFITEFVSCTDKDKCNAAQACDGRNCVLFQPERKPAPAVPVDQALPAPKNLVATLNLELDAEVKVAVIPDTEGRGKDGQELLPSSANPGPQSSSGLPGDSGSAAATTSPKDSSVSSTTQSGAKSLGSQEIVPKPQVVPSDVEAPAATTSSTTKKPQGPQHVKSKVPVVPGDGGNAVTSSSPPTVQKAAVVSRDSGSSTNSSAPPRTVGCDAIPQAQLDKMIEDFKKNSPKLLGQVQNVLDDMGLAKLKLQDMKVGTDQGVKSAAMDFFLNVGELIDGGERRASLTKVLGLNDAVFAKTSPNDAVKLVGLVPKLLTDEDTWRQVAQALGLDSESPRLNDLSAAAEKAPERPSNGSNWQEVARTLGIQDVKLTPKDILKAVSAMAEVLTNKDKRQELAVLVMNENVDIRGLDMDANDLMAAVESVLSIFLCKGKLQLLLAKADLASTQLILGQGWATTVAFVMRDWMSRFESADGTQNLGEVVDWDALFQTVKGLLNWYIQS